MERQAEREMVLVKEGFSWPAFFFTGLWALYHRMWGTALGLFLASAALGAGVDAWALGSAGEAAVSLAFLALVGFHANDWRRQALARRGFEERGAVAGSRLEAAELRALRVLGADLAVCTTDAPVGTGAPPGTGTPPGAGASAGTGDAGARA